MEYSYGDYSKHYITDALFKLMESTPFRDITISDVAKKAGVGRATFYRYFSTKEDVIRFFFEHTTSEFTDEQLYRPRSREDYEEIVGRVLKYIKMHKRRLQLLVSAKLEYIYTDYVDLALSKNFTGDVEEPNLYEASGFAGAISGITLRWIKSDCPDDDKKVLDAFCTVCLKNA